MRHRTTSLRVALALLILLVVLPLLAIQAYTNVRERLHAIEDARERVERLVVLVAANQRRLTEGTAHLLPLLARAPELLVTDGRTCDTYLASLLARYPWYANFGVADLRGRVVCSALAFDGEVTVADRPYFRRALERDDVAAGGYQIGRITGRPTLNYGYPLRDHAGEVRGVLFAAVDLVWLNQIMLEESGLPRGATYTVFDESGKILARYPDPAMWMGQSVATTQLIRAVLGVGTSGTVVATGVDGVRRFYAFAPLHAAEFAGRTFVTVGIPETAVYAEANRALAANIVAWGAVAIAAVVLVSALIDRRVIRPVAALVAASERLRAGDLSARVDPAAVRGDELGRLAEAFDEMAGALEQRRSEDALKTGRLQALWEISQAISTAQSTTEIGAGALRHIRRMLPVARATIALFDHEAQTSQVLWVEPARPGVLQAGGGVPFETLRAASPRLIDLRPGEPRRFDLAELPDVPFLRDAREAGLGVFHVIPLAVEENVMGSLSLWEAGDRLAPEHVHIAQEVANLLAVGIQQARLRDALRRYAEELEHRVAERTEQLQVARREAERANRAKSEFLSRMSHELRTPLNAIMGFGQLLEMDEATAGQRDQIRQIVKAGRHLLDLINEVLDIARIEAGTIALSPEVIVVRDAVAEAVELIRPIADEWKVTVGEVAPQGRDLMVLADRQRLKQVLLNLLSNAVKYNRRGGRVDVLCERPGARRVRIGVRDSGPGIAPELLDRLFVPFDRIGAERTHVEGTGLGLALSRRLAEAMGGTISVQSAVGAGSTFWVELPEAATPPTLAVKSAQPAVAAAGADGRRRTILYVEDNLSNLQLVEAIVAHRPGVRLLTAIQGQIGLDLALEHRPDAIFLDLHLPDIPGVEVLGRLRAEPTLRQTPVIVLTADATAGLAERLLRAGATACMSKPIDVPQFLEALDAALAG
ncbi:MAG: ATP-binding protein [Armatimonadota bacterium]|nr:ATP-binding protein [Armatimonadota bacterium]MDR7453411.1 ATP-binding protein [Armatimonadota bacterium]MDR7456256.1 ATP-binding protein [Armatimonadota bacterium]MDR7497627.1 ATP-binding protein [Armatimonadota bacterium]